MWQPTSPAHRLYILCTFGLLIANKAEALKCYACLSPLGPCIDPFPQSGVGVITCGENEQCLKMKSLSKSGEQTITRGCVSRVTSEGCTAEVDRATYCYCARDLCNAGPRASPVRPSHLALLAAATAALGGVTGRLRG